MNEATIGVIILALVCAGLIGLIYLEASAPVYEKTICVKDIYPPTRGHQASITTASGEIFNVPVITVWPQFVRGKSHIIKYTDSGEYGKAVVEIVGKIGEVPCESVATTLPTPYLSKS